MDNDEGYNLPQQAVRKLVRMIQSLDEVMRHFQGQEYLAQGIRFLSANTKKTLEEDCRDQWKKTDLTKGYNLESLTHDTAILIWVALSLGRIVNQYRQMTGKRTVDWTARAKSIDEDERKANGKRTNV